MNHKTVAWKVLPVLLILSVLIPFVPMAQAANTGFLSPSQAAAVGTPALPTLTKSNNAFADDTSNATGSFSSSTTLGQQYFGFGASIPAGAVLQGIDVQAQYSITNNSGTNTLEVALSTDGTSWTITDTDPRSQEPKHRLFFNPRTHFGGDLGLLLI